MKTHRQCIKAGIPVGKLGQQRAWVSPEWVEYGTISEQQEQLFEGSVSTCVIGGPDGTLTHGATNRTEYFTNARRTSNMGILHRTYIQFELVQKDVISDVRLIPNGSEGNGRKGHVHKDGME